MLPIFMLAIFCILISYVSNLDIVGDFDVIDFKFDQFPSQHFSHESAICTPKILCFMKYTQFHLQGKVMTSLLLNFRLSVGDRAGRQLEVPKSSDH